MDGEMLEKKLEELGYDNLFLSDNHQLETIWEEGKNQFELEQIIRGGNSSLAAKFLANEVLSYFNIPSDNIYADSLAEAYVYALKETSVEKGNQLHLNANVWGLLYEEDDPGYLGTKMIALGNITVPYLKELLDNEDKVLYEGGEEATLGNASQYRIKDFAAFYISKIKKIPIQFFQNIIKRDLEILRFKKLLKPD